MTDTEFSKLADRLHRQSDESAIQISTISDDELAALDREQAAELAARFGATTMIELPQREQEFFAWVRDNDPMVWSDVWDDSENPYVVSLSFLPDLLPKGRGFPICDLVDNPNFYFTTQNIAADDGSPLLDAALAIARSAGKLEMYQAFLVEVWRAPIDQWRFAWIYKQPLNTVKEMVQWMISEEILVQVAEDEEGFDPSQSELHPEDMQQSDHDRS